jgi:outer membrane lipoprotein
MTISNSNPTSTRTSGTGRLAGILLLALVLSGCASSPFSDAGYVPALGPADALRGGVATGQRMLWGGRIVAVVNTAEATEIEVLALPLDRSDRPRGSAEGGVRFVVRQTGFLEPMNYAPGRLVTVLGRFDGIVERPVGDYLIDQPVLDARRIELWPVYDARPRTSIGVGVGIRL